MTDNDNDIDALLRHLNGQWIVGTDKGIDEMYNGFASALTALVAERDALKQRVEELGTSVSKLAILNGQLLEQPPASDLRERLLESALRGAVAFAHMHHEASSMGTRAVYIVDAAIAAMRKGEA